MIGSDADDLYTFIRFSLGASCFHIDDLSRFQIDRDCRRTRSGHIGQDRLLGLNDEASRFREHALYLKCWLFTFFSLQKHREIE